MGKTKRSKKAPSKKAFDLKEARKQLKKLRESEQGILKKQNRLLRTINNQQKVLLEELGVGLCKQAEQLEYLLLELNKIKDSVINPSLN